MWEMMVECHRLQLHTISVSQTPGSMKITVQTDLRRQITVHLENELSTLSSIFRKWISAQKFYVESIDKWLFKCVLIKEKPTKRNKRMRPPPIRNRGPPIYTICGAWLEMIEQLPSKGVVDSIKDLEVEVTHFLPHQEKSHGKSGGHGATVLGDEVSHDRIPAMDRFRTSMAGFLGQLNNFAESSETMFSNLQRAIEEAKNNYEQPKAQQV